jgi:hypothetical protein
MAAEEISAFKLDLFETLSTNGPDECRSLEHDKLAVQQILPIENHIQPYLDPSLRLFIMRGLRHCRTGAA